MRLCRSLRVLTVLFPLGLSAAVGPMMPVGATSLLSVTPAAPPASSVARLPLAFEPNVGQASPGVKYLAHGPGYTLLLTDAGASMVFSSPREARGRDPLAPSLDAARASHDATATISLTPAHARLHPQLQAMGKQRGKVNYLIGSDPSRWHVDVPTFSQVVYRGIYPGINLVFRGGAGGRLEYDWILRPHANFRDILMRVQGARSLRLERDGSVALRMPAGVIHQQAPHLYQTQSGKRVAIAGGFRLLSGDRLGLRLGRYDAWRTLTVDPQLTYSTYFGNAAEVKAVAVDRSNAAYVAGDAGQGFDIPLKNPFQSRFQGGVWDVFVAKMSTDGTGLIFSTYLGGVSDDYATTLAVDDAGSAYVGGVTSSENFPGAPDRFGPFVVKLNASGNNIMYSHVDKADGKDSTLAIAVDRSGDAYYTEYSSETAMEGTLVRELLPNGTLLGDPYFAGHTSTDSAIALDSRGNVYVAGYTADPRFPMLNALNPTFSGGTDAVVMELDGALSPDWSTFLGGSGNDRATGIAVDALGDVYVTGTTTSQNFPLTNPVQNALKGANDAFVTELSPFGQSYRYSTYLGGDEMGTEVATGIAVDDAGSAVVTGSTTAPNFPIVNMQGDTFHGATDVFVSRFAPGGGLVYSALLGGSGKDTGSAIALDRNDDVLVGGTTESSNFPIVGSPVQSSLSTVSGGFLLKMSNGTPLPPPPPPPGGSTATDAPTTTVLTPGETATPGVPAPAPTDTPTATPVRPPGSVTLALSSSVVNAGSKLKFTITTVPRATITITVRVKQHGSVVFAKTKHGETGLHGTFKGSITFSYHPARPAKAQIKVKAATAGGSATQTGAVTIMPHA